MEALAKLAADIIEFLVGGVLFLGSIALLLRAIYPDDFGALLDQQIPSSAGSVLSIAGFALIYGFGVIAEGLSRMLFEWRLTLLTANREEFKGDTKLVARNAALLRREKIGEEIQLSALKAWEQRQVMINVREDWRTYATSSNESLGNTIEAQLKRLRIERTFFLSALMTLLAVFIEGNWMMVAATAVVCVMGAMLVEERFERFLGSIVRAHDAIDNKPPGSDTGVSSGLSA